MPRCSLEIVKLEKQYKYGHSERALALRNLLFTVSINCHPERRRSFTGEAPSQSRDLLFGTDAKEKADSSHAFAALRLQTARNDNDFES